MKPTAKCKCRAFDSSFENCTAVTAEHTAKDEALPSVTVGLLCDRSGCTPMTQALPRPSANSQTHHSQSCLNPSLDVRSPPQSNAYIPSNFLMVPCIPVLCSRQKNSPKQKKPISKILKVFQPTARNTYLLMKYYLLLKA